MVWSKRKVAWHATRNMKYDLQQVCSDFRKCLQYLQAICTAVIFYDIQITETTAADRQHQAVEYIKKLWRPFCFTRETVLS